MNPCDELLHAHRAIHRGERKFEKELRHNTLRDYLGYAQKLIVAGVICRT